VIRPGIVAGLLMVVTVVAAKPPVDLETAARMVQKAIDGRVLGGKTVSEDDRAIHVIRVLTPEGRVIHIRVDRETGKILKRPHQ